MIKKLHFFSAACAAVSFLMLGAGLFYAADLPDSFRIVAGEKFELNGLPVGLSGNDAIAADVSDGGSGDYQSDLKLFSVIEVKKVNVSVVRPTDVVPGGQAFGVKLYTQGVMVVGMSDVDTANGPKNPAYDAGIRKGDILLMIDGKAVNSNSEVSAAFSAAGGKTVKVVARRNGKNFTTQVKPRLSVSEKEYKAGLWVRDSTAGIGTITFYDPQNGIFAGLGHGICDIDTGELLPLMTGDAVKADIESIQRGTKGHAGELEGMLQDEEIGSLRANCQTGVYGMTNGVMTGQKIPVAMCQQVHPGSATILTSLDSTGPHSYQIMIVKVDYNASPTKNMVIRITDQTLIDQTGGIVQGMSGSPILQDGRLVGAVTHVFVDNPELGYGIFAENMLNDANTIAKQNKKVVS